MDSFWAQWNRKFSKRTQHATILMAIIIMRILQMFSVIRSRRLSLIHMQILTKLEIKSRVTLLLRT